MIDISGINAGYGKEAVISEITCSVHRGSFFGIIGPNGSGKTTLLKTLSRVLSLQKGTVVIKGKEILDYSQKDLAQTLGVVPQETSAGFDFSVRDVVMMGRNPYQGRFSQESEEDLKIVQMAMEMTRTTGFADRSIREISGGERQRVIIARALAQDPDILLLDEATAHLDISHQIEILSLFRNLGEKYTVVAVFHDLNLASQFCDRLILLSEGRIAATGTPAGVLTEENIRSHFGIEAMIRRDPLTGKPSVFPIIAEKMMHEEKGPRIHIISGGGGGGEVMQALSRRGYRLSAGVLAVNDSDYKTAETLGIPCISEAPFAPVSEDSAKKLEECLSAAERVVVAPMAIGPGNIRNLICLKTVEASRIIFMKKEGEKFRFDDFTGGKAEALVRELMGSGAVETEVIGTMERIEREE